MIWLIKHSVSHTSRTVYCTAPFLLCKLLKYIEFLAATNSSKAEVARSNTAGQAKFHGAKSKLNQYPEY